MEGEIDGNAVLDFAVFDITVAQNRFNATVCRKSVTEKVATGSLDQLALHLTEVNVFCSGGLSESFKLEVSETAEGFSWFTKSTMSGFLYLVNAPDLLKSAHAIENEISQLEGTRKFHLSLYTKDLPECSTSALEDNGDSKENGSTQKGKEDTSSDLTKNELLRALDLRLMALREELSVTFSRVLGSASSTKQISDLAAFCQYFGAAEMRTLLLKYLELGAREQVPNASDQQTSALPQEVPSNSGKTVDISFQPVSWTDTLKSVSTSISPAKIAQAERQSSSESEEPSDSSDEDQPVAERSRPLTRSASPRRSASPMRRVQIGRSGSRRPTALTIKSISYFPARERTTHMDADGNGSGNEESEQPPNRTETNVRRMSVQDAIHLFESKQSDQNSNIQSRKGFNEISANTNKSVLRRWSAGMGESSEQCIQVTSSDVVLPNNSNNLVLQAEELKIQPESDITIADINKVEDSVDKTPAAEESVPSLLIKSATDLDVPKAEEIQENSTDSAEWTRQKEAELNQMLMKLMESKPSKYGNTTSGNSGNPASEKKGVIHRQYKEKGDVKLQAETDRKRTEKEGQLKVMQETLDQRKAKTGLKASGVSGKLDSSSHPQKSRRNSSPPVLSKKEMPKSAAIRKPSPKTSSPMPTTRNSWPSIPSPRTAGTPPSNASATTTKNTTSSGRKPQPMLSPSLRSLKPERSLLQSKGTKETQSEGKIFSKVQENRKQSSTASSRSAKAKLSAPSGNGSGAVSAKPTLYNKAKKSSVVPLESKPFLRKGTGSSHGAGSTVAKTLHQFDDLSMASGNLLPDEEKESVLEKTEALSEQPKEVLVETVNSDDRKYDYPVSSDLNCEITHGVDPVVEVDNNVMKSVWIPTEESQPVEDLDISSAAWVELDQQGTSESCDSGMPQMADSEIAPLPSSSPRVRHSLSQMLQADNGEMEILEWGNAENPPAALIYQKDAPKGLKRLLKFGRKSKEVSLAGWSSPSVFSEGEEDTEEARTNGKRSTDALLRKATVQTKGFGKQKTALSESYDGGYSSKRSMDHSTHDILSGQSSMNNFPSSNSHKLKLREGHLSTSATSGKATRSFFSLSTFRSSKSNETKLR